MQNLLLLPQSTARTVADSCVIPHRDICLHFCSSQNGFKQGTGIRRLTRGLEKPRAFSGQRQSWKTPASLWSDTFSFIALTLLVGWQEGHPACITLGVGLLVVTISLQLCTSYSSRCHHHVHQSSLAPTNSRTETFWYQCTRVVLENGH